MQMQACYNSIAVANHFGADCDLSKRNHELTSYITFMKNSSVNGEFPEFVSL